MIIDDVAQYLEDQAVGVQGNNIFLTYLPDDVDDCTVVRDTGGLAPDPYTPQREPTFQIYIKAPDYVTGRNRLDSIRNLLHQKANVQLVNDGTYFYYILATSDGGSLGRDEANRELFSINFKCKIRQ